ncbi:uncharacterized protein STEHIDRAFT_123998 [Stereum hirsutum FP-91666 SS1]|uniref:uncharacterized protein n=1 Tax=Stereum hirsutum (strain FP-91666) TaxID=721885 RepID=UPI000444A414|nr:uncharacterized protein STEHIDRAFT_123998 [Stereum hirsutum FP-91666 SS1]EIM83618.1 hypothetical protein STEHIDRAFT_123998 [Stereum hirsutum FP-91666 SS1]
MLPGQRPQKFFVDELQNSLEEQLNLGAIKSFRVVSNTNTEAIAQVALLEDQTVEVVLNGAGYQATSEDGAKIYETVEGFLDSRSMAYSAKRHEVLLAKLESLSEA